VLACASVQSGLEGPKCLTTMRPGQRQSLPKSLLDEIVIRDGTIESAKPKADWPPHLEAVFACPA